MKDKIIKIIMWLFVLIMIIIIFLFSNMSSGSSNSKSKEIIRDSIVLVDNVFNINMNDVEINKLVNKLNYPFRKICHFMEYFILSLLLVISLNISNVGTKKTIIITICFCFIFSLSDEIHQMFIVGRSPMFIDCIIDTLGCCLLCFIYYLRTNKIN